MVGERLDNREEHMLLLGPKPLAKGVAGPTFTSLYN